MKYYILLLLLLFISIINAQEMKYGIIKSNGEVVLETQYDDIWKASSGMIAVKKDKKWGYVDTLGKMVIPPKYYDIGERIFYGNYALVKKKKDKVFEYVLIDKKGKELKFFHYLPELRLYNDIIFFREKKLVGFMNVNGEIIAEAQFVDIAYKPQNKNLIIVKKDGKYACIDKNAKVIIPYEYDKITHDKYNPLYVVLEKNEKKGYANQQGEIIIPVKYDFLDGYVDDMILVGTDDVWGYYNTKGKLAIRLKKGAFASEFIKKHGKTPIEAHFSDGMLAQVEGNMVSFINKKGKKVISDIPKKLYNFAKFEHGFCILTNDETDSSLVIDKKGKKVIPFTENRLKITRYNHKPVVYMYGKKDNQNTLLVKDLNTLETIINFKYSDLFIAKEFQEGYAFFWQKQKCGIINSKQKIVVPAKFDALRYIGNGLWRVGSKQKKEVITLAEKAKIDTNTVYLMVEEMPTFVGGIKGLAKYLKDNLRYPKEAKEKSIEGPVYMEFVVEKDGSLTNIRVLKGIGKGCDEEAIRLMKNSPKWKPGKQKEMIVKVKMQQPIYFRLEDK